jgi:hypothetical protein
MNKERLNQAKHFMLIIVFAVGVLIVTVSLLNMSKQNIAGKAFYRPVEIYGEVSPDLPDGTQISFVVGQIEVASTVLKNNTYGYDPKLYFKMDDPMTLKIEGYAKGDTAKVYIENVYVVEYSYFDPWATKKDIMIPASKRVEISNRAAESAIRRGCSPNWQCGEWSACSNSLQTRKCIDMMNCGFDDGKPTETRNCAGRAPVEQPAQEGGFPWNWLFVVLFVFLAVGFFVNVYRRAKYMAAHEGRHHKRR